MALFKSEEGPGMLSKDYLSAWAGNQLETGPYSMAELSGAMGAVEANRELMKDVEAMREGDLGLSEQEREQLASEAQTAAGAQIQAQQAELTRERMGSGGGFGGQYAEMQQQLGGQAAEAGARARADADKMSQQLAEARRAEILGRLERQQDRFAENTKWAYEQWNDAMGGVMDYGIATFEPATPTT